jgi:hypothetical protein
MAAVDRAHPHYDAGSALALAQARYVLALCRRRSLGGLRNEDTRTTGTGGNPRRWRIRASGLARRLFTKEPEVALLRGRRTGGAQSERIFPLSARGSAIGGVLTRGDVRDVRSRGRRSSGRPGGGRRRWRPAQWWRPAARGGRLTAAFRPDLKVIETRAMRRRGLRSWRLHTMAGTEWWRRPGWPAGDPDGCRRLLRGVRWILTPAGWMGDCGGIPAARGHGAGGRGQAAIGLNAGTAIVASCACAAIGDEDTLRCVRASGLWRGSEALSPAR